MAFAGIEVVIFLAGSAEWGEEPENSRPETSRRLKNKWTNEKG